MRVLLMSGLLLTGAAATALAAQAVPATTARVYRIELVGGGVVWSDDAPLQSGDQVLFHGHPAGALKSLKRSEIRRIVATSTTLPTTVAVRPGEAVDIGATGPGSHRATGTRPLPARGTGPRPGENRDGSALFNSDRTYRPDWDGKLVPGSTLGYPNSPDDYKEGRTLAHPSASATQAAPGDPPTMKPSSGEPPKPPNQ
jgi:hypothetical protein